MAPDKDDRDDPVGGDTAAAARDDRELAASFARGDFARVRSRVREIDQDPRASPQQRARAHELLKRVSADVVVYAMLAFALLVFCAIVLRYAGPSAAFFHSTR